jgi:hypothetical protein
MNLLQNEEELKATLKRAAEIAAADGTPAEEVQSLEIYLRAAEESGIPRAAFLAAMQERMTAPVLQAETGTRVFAPSPDGFWYVAEVLSCENGSVRVRFLHGGEHTCAELSLRPFSLIPGVKLQVRHNTWGWMDGTVHTFDEAQGLLKVDDGFSSSSHPLIDIRLPKVKTLREKRLGEVYWRAAITFGSIGTAVGWLLHALLSR